MLLTNIMSDDSKYLCIGFHVDLAMRRPLIPRYRVLRTRIVFIEYLILGRGMEGSKQIQKIFFVLTTWTLLASSQGLRLGTLGHNYGTTRKHELCSRSGSKSELQKKQKQGAARVSSSAVSC